MAMVRLPGSHSAPSVCRHVQWVCECACSYIISPRRVLPMSALSRLTSVATLCAVAGCTAPPQSAPEPQQFGYAHAGVSGPTIYRGLIQPTNGGAVKGNLVLMPQQSGGGSTATLSVAGPAGTYSWHILYGACATTGGSLLGSQSDYRTFQVGPQGNGGTSTTITSVPSGGNFHVVVQATDDPLAAGNIVGCGEVLNTGV
jgi:hypothetical protein